MRKFNLQIVTPKSTIFSSEVEFVTAPGADGELSVLAGHVPLFTLLKDGVVTVFDGQKQTYYSIGGGYLETVGKVTTLLVSRAYGQEEIDEAEIEKARVRAEKMLKEAPETADREEAMRVLKRSMVDMKLLQKVRLRK